MSNWNGIDRRSHAGPTGRRGMTPGKRKAGMTGCESPTTWRLIQEFTGIGMVRDVFEDTWGYENYGRRKGDIKAEEC